MAENLTPPQIRAPKVRADPQLFFAKIEVKSTDTIRKHQKGPRKKDDGFFRTVPDFGSQKDPFLNTPKIQKRMTSTVKGSPKIFGCNLCHLPFAKIRHAQTTLRLQLKKIAKSTDFGAS